MASKLRSNYGDDALNRATEDFTARTPPRLERGGSRSAPVATRALSADLGKPVAAAKAHANFDPSSSREAVIATAAYYRAQRRGFAPGHELEDWIAAEREVDAVGTDLI